MATGRSKLKLIVAAVVVLAVVVYLICASGAIARSYAKLKAAAGNITRGNGAEALAGSFKTCTCIDKDGTGTEAFKFDAPADWDVQADLKWRLDRPCMPADPKVRITNPKGREAVEIYPNQPFFSASDEVAEAMYLGDEFWGGKVCEPINAMEALKRIVIPDARGRCVGVKVVSERDFSDRLSDLFGGTASAAKARIEYTENGVAMEEEFFCVVQCTSLQVMTHAGPAGITSWWTDFACSFKAEKGKLDSMAPVFRKIVGSFTMDLGWFCKYNQLVGYLWQSGTDRIGSLQELRSLLSSAGGAPDGVTQLMHAQRQAVYGRIAEQIAK